MTYRRTTTTLVKFGSRSPLPMIFLIVGIGSCASTPPLQTATGVATAGQPPKGAEASAPGCERAGDGFGQVLVSTESYGSRTGVMAKRFSELGLTSKDKPLEECGIPTVISRLLALRCDDGSNPFDGDLGDVPAARAGNVGPGGRCRSIIDLYEVPCPERTYHVFADSYVCTGPIGR